MKIAVLGTRGFPNVPGGVEAHCEHLYPLLAEHGCEVTVFARKAYVHASLPYRYKGVRIVPLSCPKNKFFEAFVHTFLGLLAAKKMRSDVLHVHAIGPSLLIPLARMLGFKIVMTHHGPDYERKKWNRAARMILRAGEFAGCRWAHEVIAVTEGIALQIKRKFAKEAVIIPNGVRIRQCCDTQDTLQRYGLASQRYILSVGRFVPEKGFHDLVRAFSKLQDSNDLLQQSGWKLVIAGDADHEDEYSKNLKAQALKIRNIVMTGYLSEQPLRELYSHAGLFVLPSYYEGLPIALLEAMSFGASCIASDIISENKELGFDARRLFRTGDLKALEEKMEEYVSTPLQETQKEHQLESIRENFDWEKIADRTVRVYRRLR